MEPFPCKKYDKHKTDVWYWSLKKLKKPSSEKISWQQQLAKELHKPVKRDFTWWRVIVNDVDGLWAQDLVDMQKFS